MSERQTDAAVLSAAVRGIRRLKGYTSQQTASGMNLSLRTYQDFEAGKVRLNMDYVYRFCRFVDADPEALLIALAIGSPEFAIRCANNKLMRLIEVLEDDDDVQNVTTNVEASEDVMAAYAAS